ncbi:hypothetical protein [Desulfolucanica intricata]|uniref:hypothetical protein n=1 Tax=Desulfolucanica intricata TaxID=1285191 RepID=UPI00083191AB|nr:hypothetical protein [Desulfolucanica intricata]
MGWNFVSAYNEKEIQKKSLENIKLLQTRAVELQKQENNLTGMALTYESLVNRLSLSPQEEKLLLKLTGEIAVAVPEAITGYDTKGRPKIDLQYLKPVVANELARLRKQRFDQIETSAEIFEVLLPVYRKDMIAAKNKLERVQNIMNTSGNIGWELFCFDPLNYLRFILFSGESAESRISKLQVVYLEQYQKTTEVLLLAQDILHNYKLIRNMPEYSDYNRYNDNQDIWNSEVKAGKGTPSYPSPAMIRAHQENEAIREKYGLTEQGRIGLP